MGSKHADLTLPLVPQLLAIHPFFLLPEPDVEDPHYITVLILVFNAAKHCSTMLQLFEEHTIKHYSYLRVTLPTLVPHLDLTRVKEQESAIRDVLSSGSEFLGSLVSRVASSDQAGARARLAHSIIPHLERIALTDASLSSAARFAATFLQAQLLVRTVLSDSMWCSNAAATTVQGNATKNSITQILTLALKLEYLFVGLDKAEQSLIKQFKLKALALHLVYIVRVSNRSALALCEHFLALVENTQRFHVDNELGCDEFCKGVFSRMNSLEDLKPGAVARCLLPLLSSATLITTPRPNIQMRMCRAVLNGPVSSADAPIKFTAGLVIATTLDADIYGLRDPSALRIKIHYPDQQTHISVPSLHDIRPTGNGNSLEAEYRLLTCALISHTIWTEACYVEMTLCLELSEGELTHRTHYSIDPYLELCPPLKLHVAPKPVKRGI